MSRLSVSLIASPRTAGVDRFGTVLRFRSRMRHGSSRSRTGDLATAVAAVVRADRRDAALGATAEGTARRDQGAEATHPGSRAARESTESGQAYDTLDRRDATTARMREAGLSEESIDVAMRAEIARGGRSRRGHRRAFGPARNGWTRSRSRNSPTRCTRSGRWCQSAGRGFASEC